VRVKITLVSVSVYKSRGQDSSDYFRNYDRLFWNVIANPIVRRFFFLVSCPSINLSCACRNHIHACQILNACGNYSQSVEITLKRVFITLGHNHTHTSQTYSRGCRKHTLHVKSHSACGNLTLHVEINFVRVEITLVRVLITFVSVLITVIRVKITLCV
jgi:hypothetical protein